MAVAGYPLTFGASGRARSARAAMSSTARTARNSAAAGSSPPPETLPPARREPVHRPVVLDDHAVGVALGAGALDVDRGAAGLVGDPPPEATQAPTEVDVLHVHEVPLVPAPDRVDRGAAQEDQRARHPVDVARRVPVGVELAVPTGEAVARPRSVRAAAWPTASSPLDGAARADGYCVPSGLRSAGPTAARSGSAAKRASIAAAVPGSHLEVGVADGDDRRASSRAMPRLAAAAYPRLPSGVDHPHRGKRALDARRPTRRREPLSTTTTSGVPALVSASSDSHAREQERPGLVVDDDRGPAGAPTPVARRPTPRQSTKRYLTRVQSATNPSRQVIFLPSSNSRPVYEIGTS